MALSPREMHERIIENLAAKTGHSFEYWLRVVVKQRKEKSDKELIAHLKNKHGLGHYTAVAIIKQSVTGNEYDVPDDLITALFIGKSKARQLYEAIDGQVLTLSGAERVPCKTYVGYRRKTQFLIIAPMGDVGVKCGLTLPPDRTVLAPASNYGSHRIRSQIEVLDEGMTGKLWAFIQKAYELSA